MNILSFGMGGLDPDGNLVPGFGYGETIAGGSGAGPDWHGVSGTQVHMTNTKITDPEIMEKRVRGSLVYHRRSRPPIDQDVS
jgi:5-oxoprolinase (ATP-hydrolysing)